MSEESVNQKLANVLAFLLEEAERVHAAFMNDFGESVINETALSAARIILGDIEDRRIPEIQNADADKAEDSGKKLFQYEGDAILRVWPLSDDSALEVVGWEYLANDKWYRGVDNDRKSVEKFGYPIRLLYADSDRQTCRSKTADSEPQKILMSESETQADGCDWHQEDESGECWSASCGALFSLYEGTPSANGMRFCHSCGKPLVEHKWQDDEASTVTQKGDEGVSAQKIQDAISHEN